MVEYEVSDGMGTGQAFVKWLKPGGAALVLILAVIATVMLFTARGTPVEGYAAPHGGDYYADRLSELKTEIETNLLPKIDAPGVELGLSEGAVTVTGPKEPLQTARLAIIHYFDPELFEFTEVPE